MKIDEIRGFRRRPQEVLLRRPLLEDTRLHSSDDDNNNYEEMASSRGAARRRWPTKRPPQRRRLKRSRGSSNINDEELRVSVYCVGDRVDCILLLARLGDGFVRRPPGNWVDVIWENSVHSSWYEDDNEWYKHSNLEDLEISNKNFDQEEAQPRNEIRNNDDVEAAYDASGDDQQQHEQAFLPSPVRSPTRRSFYTKSAEHLAEIKSSPRCIHDDEEFIRKLRLKQKNARINFISGNFMHNDSEGEQDNDQNIERDTEMKQQVITSSNAKHFFVFGFGCIVLWGFEKREERAIVSGLLADEVAVVTGVTSAAERVEAHDTMAYVVEESTNLHNRIWCKNDVIRLSSNDPYQKFSLSYAMAQSAKLFIWEMRVDDTINDVKYIPERLASTGKTDLTEKQISKMIGKVFIERTQVNLHSDILDSPDFLWEDDIHEPAYTFFKFHLDVPERVDLLNTRLDVLRDLLEVLNTQLSNHHSSRLELIVIWLIVAEIVVTIFTFVFDRILPKHFYNYAD